VTTRASGTGGAGTVWRIRLFREAAAAYEQDLATLGIDRSEALRRGLRLLHREALETRMAREVEDFYAGGRAPLRRYGRVVRRGCWGSTGQRVSKLTSGRARGPLRGEVWDAVVPRAGTHPVVILTINALLQRLSSTTAVLITGTPGPPSTHIPLDADAGLTRNAESYAVATELHNVPLQALRRHRGRLQRHELRALEDAIRIAHGLVDADL
jgi:mRNA interferase MazF